MSPPDSLAAAYAACVRLARAHDENFPVASVLLPRRMRPHVAAVYAFARIADDLADEGDLAPAERLRRLDEWQQRLLACAATRPQHPGPSTLDPAPWTLDPAPDLVFHALGHTIRTRQLPLSLFEDLLSAFRQDVTKRHYETWDELLDYCRRSANPVGRLVLRIAGYSDERLDRSSDCLCTALQLTNLWQDLDRDRRRGRSYLPADIRQKWGAGEADLERGQLTREWKQALADAVQRTNSLFARGKPVCDASRGRLRVELRLTWLGGTRILERLQQIDYDPLTVRPTLRRSDVWLLLWRLLRWRRTRALKDAP